MPNVLHKQSFSAKTCTNIDSLKEIRQWLRINCKSRWSATNYRGEDFNWRKLARADFQDLAEFGIDITIIVHFKKPEDLMLYLLSWPSDILVNE